MADRIEIVIAGFGGQGAVLAAEVLGQAAAPSWNHVSVAAAYGPEARGTLTLAEVVLARGLLEFPRAESPAWAFALCARGLDEIASRWPAASCCMLYDDSLVTDPPKVPPGFTLRAAPVSRLAVEKFTRTQANMIALGVLAKATGAVRPEDLLAVLPGGGKTAALNAEAVKFGLAMELQVVN